MARWRFLTPRQGLPGKSICKLEWEAAGERSALKEKSSYSSASWRIRSGPAWVKIT